MAARRDQEDSAITKSTAAFGYVIAALVIWFGWVIRDQHYLSAEFGLGYALGIAGASLMGLLFLYPLRKRFRSWRIFGPTRHWFRVHMWFGVIGPVLVLYHCNFSLGSFNSQVALYSTLAVAISGLIGRYIYAHIHRGLFGQKLSLDELREDFGDLQSSETVVGRFLPAVIGDLHRLEERVMKTDTGFLMAVWVALYAGAAGHLYRLWSYIRIRVEVKRFCSSSEALMGERKRLVRNADNYVARRLRTLRKFSQFSLFERLFSVWQIVHYPFFVLLAVTVPIHIIAVHMY